MKSEVLLLLILFKTILSAQQIKLTASIIWEIGGVSETKKEFYFKMPASIAVDKENNLYISENNGTKIIKCSKEGNWIRMIGGKGAGPGEFKHIEKMFITDDNEILVKDQINGRYMFLSLDGSYLKSIPIGGENRKFYKLNNFFDGKLYAQVQVNENMSKHGNKFVVVDKNLEEKITSFGYSSIFWDYETVMGKIQDDLCDLNTLCGSNSRFWVSKSYYDGRIFLFDKQKQWKLTVFEGKRLSHSSYEIMEKQAGSGRPNSNGYSYFSMGNSLSGSGKATYIKVITKSIGLFEYNNKYIINFIAHQKGKDKVLFGLELFSIEGNYLGFYEIKEIKGETLDEVLCMDYEGNFIMRAFDNGGFLIRKFKLKIG